MTSPAARTGLWGAFVLATSMNGIPGNTARNGLKIVPSSQNDDSETLDTGSAAGQSADDAVPALRSEAWERLPRKVGSIRSCSRSQDQSGSDGRRGEELEVRQSG